MLTKQTLPRGDGIATHSMSPGWVPARSTSSKAMP